MISLQPALATHWAGIESLLALGYAPLAGVNLPSSANCFVADDGDDFLGFCAVERFQGVGLLRAVCVKERYRYQGLARRLVDYATADARAQGVEQLFVASPLWHLPLMMKTGFAVERPALVPAAIQHRLLGPWNAAYLTICSKRTTPMPLALAA